MYIIVNGEGRFLNQDGSISSLPPMACPATPLVRGYRGGRHDQHRQACTELATAQAWAVAWNSRWAAPWGSVGLVPIGTTIAQAEDKATEAYFRAFGYR